MKRSGRGRGDNGTTLRAGRVLAFASRRVAAFSLVALAVAGVALAPTACSSPVNGTATSFDAAPPPPPGACVVTQSAVALCEAGPLVEPSDAGVDASDASDAEAVEGGEPVDAAPDAVGPVVAPASENRCLVTQDVAIACPSAIASAFVASGKEGASDVLVAQRGLGFHASPESAALSNDDQAYLQQVHLDVRGEGAITMDPVPPYSVKSPPTAGTLLLPGGARDASLLTFTTAPNSPTSMRVSGATFEVPGQSLLATFAAGSGEVFLTAQPQGGVSGDVLLVRGLPDAPRSVKGSVPGWRLRTASVDPSGSPVGLFTNIAENSVRILEGENFTKERWKGGSRNGEALDFVYVDEPAGAVPAVLLGDLGGEVTALFARTGTREGGYATLGKSFSTCDRSSYVGISCDACPVTKSCEIGSDQMRDVRLFTRAGRLFAIYYSTDVRHRMGYSLDKTPIIGLGCVCALTERDTREFADSLVVLEIVAPADPMTPPKVVEYMRLPVSKARSTGTVQLVPRSDGDVDVLLGPSLSRFDETVTKLPEAPSPLRVLRISTKNL